LPQTWARLRGDDSNGKVLIVGGHYDAWEPGMSDNAAGNALILELAALMAPLKGQLKRDIIFALWNGHEIGEIAGSTWFLDTHWDDIDERGIAYFNVDSVGFTRTSHFETASTTELVRFHQDVESLVLGHPENERSLPEAMSNHSSQLACPRSKAAIAKASNRSRPRTGPVAVGGGTVQRIHWTKSTPNATDRPEASMPGISWRCVRVPSYRSTMPTALTI
jgi:Zn-dependent M28 family amino/carboxypeptidase